MTNEPSFLVIDLFCGAGGTSTGFAAADGFKVIACVNHDANAILSHAANHPECIHYTEDIRTIDLNPVVDNLNYYRNQYPDALVILWASLECTNFSKAKGGKPRDADSRTLAEHLFRYIEAINPDYLQIENVVEFMSWGPLDENGKPISKKNGCDFLRWRNTINAYGYRDEWRELNSANFGAYTSRNRLFGMFAKEGLPIVFPQPTHSKKTASGMFTGLKPWKAVKEVLDLNDTGNSIFDRKKPLVDKSLERIYAGLLKFVAGGKDAFLVKYNSMNRSGHYCAPDMDDPLAVIPTRNTHYLAFISKYFSGKPEGKNISPDGPAGTIKTIDGQSLVFMDYYYGNGHQSSPNEPAHTLTTKDRVSAITAQFIVREFTTGNNSSSLEKPLGAILSNPKSNLLSAFLMPTNFSNTPTDINDPCTTITADRHWHYLINPSWFGNMSPTNLPCPVIIARGDKSPLYLVNCESGHIAIRIDPDDSEIMLKIKEFMIIYGIVDIKMRMLKVPELLKIQGFPDNYKLIGTQADQKKFIGNSVVPHVVTAWAKAMYQHIITDKIKVA